MDTCVRIYSKSNHLCKVCLFIRKDRMPQNYGNFCFLYMKYKLKRYRVVDIDDGNWHSLWLSLSSDTKTLHSCAIQSAIYYFLVMKKNIIEIQQKGKESSRMSAAAKKVTYANVAYVPFCCYHKLIQTIHS